MELPRLENIELHDLDRWFSTFVDKVNYNSQQVEGAVGALDKELSTIDTAPIHYLRNSLEKMVNDMNDAMQRISRGMESMEKRLKSLED